MSLWLSKGCLTHACLRGTDKRPVASAFTALIFFKASKYSFSTALTNISEPLLTVFQKAEDDRRLEYGLAPLMRFPKSARMPLKDVDLTDNEEVTAFRSQLGTIVGLLDQLSEGIETRPNTGIEKRAMRRAHYGNGKIKVPKFPEQQQWTKENLVQYLNTIVKRQFADWKLDSSVGVVQALIKDLLRINNSKTIHALSLDAYKIAIEHFIRQRQIRSARLLLNDMPAVNIKPDLDVFNAFLLSNEITVRNDKAKVVVHPLMVTERLLRAMLDEQVLANYETWNAVLGSLPGSLGKSLLLQEMKKRNIPLTARSHAIIIQDLIKLRDTKFVLNYLNDLQDANVGLGILGIVVQQLLEERKYTVAWDYLLYASKKWNIKPNTDMLNNFAAHLAATTQRVDWILGIWAAMERRWQVKADPMTWAYIFEAAQKCPLHRRTNTVLELIYAHMAESGLSPRAKMMVRVVLRKAEFYRDKCGQKLPYFQPGPSEDQKIALNAYKECFRWSFPDEENRFKNGDNPIDNIHYGPRDSERSIKASELGVPRYQHNMQKPTMHIRRNKLLNEARRGSAKLRKFEKLSMVEEYKKELMELGPAKKLQKDLESLGVVKPSSEL